MRMFKVRLLAAYFTAYLQDTTRTYLCNEFESCKSQDNCNKIK